MKVAALLISLATFCGVVAGGILDATTDAPGWAVVALVLVVCNQVVWSETPDVLRELVRWRAVRRLTAGMPPRLARADVEEVVESLRRRAAGEED